MPKGFTLVELMATIAVAITALAVVVPGYFAFVEHQRVLAATHRLVAHLHLARSESVKTNVRVALCPSIDGERCADGFDWTGGFIVFRDDNRDRERQATEELLRRVAGVTGIRVLTSTGRRRIVYEPDGSVTGGSNATFRVCGTSSEDRNRAVIVANTGRARTARRDANGQLPLCG